MSARAVHHGRIVLLLMGFAALGHLNRVGISVAGSEVFIPRYGISETNMGWVYTAFLIAYTVGMLPGGWLIDRIGSVRTMTLFGLSMGLCIACTGSLGWQTSSAFGLWIGLLAIRAVSGICSVPLHPGAAHVVSEYVPVRYRTTANGLVTAGALVGVAFSYPVYGWMNDRLGWAAAFVVGGGVMFAFAWLWRMSTASLLTNRGVVHVAHTDNEAVLSLPAESKMSLLRDKNLWLIAISYAAYGYFQYLFFYWMGYYFKEVLHVPEVESRWISFGIMLSQGAGMALGGFSTDFICRKLGTTQGRRTIVIVGMGLGAAFGLLGVNVTGQTNVGLCLAISMAALGLCEGVFWTTVTDISRNHRGFSAAFMNTGGNLGGLISPVLTPMMAVGLSGRVRAPHRRVAAKRFMLG
jgi:MFS transporter, ACS family, D-galactonate transporter